jgi:hypothetical protein
LAGVVDESATGSANFFARTSALPARAAAGRSRVSAVPHPPRPPAFGHGFTSFVWGVGLGLYVWLFLWAVGVSEGTALLFGLICGTLIFFAVLLYGDNPVRRARR